MTPCCARLATSDDGVGFSDGRIGCGIEYAAGPDVHALLFRQPKTLPCDAVGVDIAGTQNADGSRQFSDSGNGGREQNVQFYETSGVLDGFRRR